ncbi:MAG TPA: calcium/proton exchanger [Thermoleophilaceae bacterium]|nr:calcium/proton exchanger [Thermoleophilaceae bacterium]
MSRLYFLSVFIPVAVALELTDAPATAVFFTSALGLIPTAVLMSDATEHLAARSGPGIGGIVNVTFGNAPELIIAFFALAEGLQEVVKASLVGSVIGNSLLVLGAAMFAGGWKNGRQTFRREPAERVATLLLAVCVVLVLPALAQVTLGEGGLPQIGELRHHYEGWIEAVSLVVASGLVVYYVIRLTTAIRDRRGIFDVDEEDLERGEDVWSVRRSVALLAVAGVLVGVMSEVLVGSIEEASEAIGLSQFFIGVFVVGIAGNAAEHWVAVVVAIKDKMDLSLNIALGSSVQIAMFLVPVLVLASLVVGPDPMALVFNGYEVLALVVAAAIARFVTHGGHSTRNEGALLIGVYLALGVLFFLA